LITLVLGHVFLLSNSNHFMILKEILLVLPFFIWFVIFLSSNLIQCGGMTLKWLDMFL
jgi:hypothetical protein